MSKRIVLGFVVAGLALAGGWAVAQQSRSGQGKDGKDGGRFAVSAVGDSAILIDAVSGQTWILRHSADKDRSHVASVWLPVERLDAAQAQRWLEQERVLSDKAPGRQVPVPDAARAKAIQQALDEIERQHKATKDDSKATDNSRKDTAKSTGTFKDTKKQ